MIAAAVAAFIALSADPAPEITLGKRLFEDERFSTAQGDMHTSCASCHLLSDPQGYRAFTEFLSRSWVPWRKEDPRRETLRNTPTLLDAGRMPMLHFDGEFSSLEEQAFETLIGRNMGWLPDERDEALEQIRAVILDDDPANTYPEEFEGAYGVDLDGRPADEVLEWVSRAISDFVRSLESRRNAPYDRFVAANHLDAGPRSDESAKAFGARMLTEVAALETTGALKRVDGFGAVELAGLKLFFETQPERLAGNCVTCHVPPAFTDFDFHNTGVTEDEYDMAHGKGRFAALEIPALGEVERPIKRFMEHTSPRHPEHADLGLWNFVDAANSPLRDEGELSAAFLERTIARFKTPTLRNLRYTPPYFHSGNYQSLEAVIAQKARHFMYEGYAVGASRPAYSDDDDVRSESYASDAQGATYRDFPRVTWDDPPKNLTPLPRAETLRNVDPEYAAISIAPNEIAPLVAFLNALNETVSTGAAGSYAAATD